jgi:hypothetical protein
MIFSGNNYLSLSYQTGLSFNVDVAVDNLNGNCNLGFSGQNKNLNFKLNQGKIFDPENRLVYFYEANENINISGDISPNKYSYYINNNLICLNGNKTSYIISGYYINTSNCNANSEVVIEGTRPTYSLNLSPIFYITGTNYLTGSINNGNNLNFRIYSGSVTIPEGFTIQNLSNFVTNTGYFQINHYPITSGQLEDERLYEVQLNLFTNFGEVTQNFTTTGSYSGYINVNLDVLNVTDFFARTGIQTGLGDFKDNNFSTTFSIISGSLRSAPTELNKYLHVKLEYSGGNTGNFNYNIFATGYRNDTITGFISGTGFLSKRISFAGTGYDDISGVSRTGFITGVIGNSFAINGSTNQNVNIIYSGYINDYLITRPSGITISGTAINGELNYYSYLYINDYNDTVNISGNDLRTGDFFGSSVVGTLGELVIIGSPGSDLNTYRDAGSVYIFTGLNTGLSQVAKITGDNLRTGDGFGSSLAASTNGNIIYVGATGKKINGINSVTGGAVFIFTGNYLINSWAQDMMITGSDASGIDLFGYSVANNITNNILSIGAPNKKIGNSSSAGAAYIFTGNGIDFWAQWSGKITGQDTTAGDSFGFSTKISDNGENIFIGAPNDTLGSYTNAGAVYIFTGNAIDYWAQSLKITGSRLNTNHGFGHSISINSNGRIIAIGATGSNLASGNVYVFTGNGTNLWRESQILTGSNLNSNAQFGYSIKMNPDATKLLVGAVNRTVGGSTSAGSIYVFTGQNGFWIQDRLITGDLIQNDKKLGYSLDFFNNESSIIAGIPFYNNNTYTDCGLVKRFDYLQLSGFIEKITATGNISSTNSYLATGNITGNSYKRIFTEAFNLITGLYISGNITGLVDFSANNYIQNGFYVRSGIINSGINNIFIQVKSRNYPDINVLTGKLTISGYTLDNKRNNINIQYITGIR